MCKFRLKNEQLWPQNEKNSQKKEAMECKLTELRNKIKRKKLRNEN